MVHPIRQLIQGVLDPEGYRLGRLLGGLCESDGDLFRRTGGEGDLDTDTLLVRGRPRSPLLPFVLTGKGDGVRRLRCGERVLDRERDGDRDTEEVKLLSLLLRGGGDLDLDRDLDSLLVTLLSRPRRRTFSTLLRGGLGLLERESDLLE